MSGAATCGFTSTSIAVRLSHGMRQATIHTIQRTKTIRFGRSLGSGSINSTNRKENAMHPEKALELVGRYSRLTKEIKTLRASIGDHLTRCQGSDGKRLEQDEWGSYINQTDWDEKNRDKSTHLYDWYTPERGEYGREWYDMSDAEDECQHCWSAHLAVQKRKQARKELGSVKRAMTRFG